MAFETLSLEAGFATKEEGDSNLANANSAWHAYKDLRLTELTPMSKYIYL